MHLQIAYIMLLCDIFLQRHTQSLPLPLSTQRLHLFSLALCLFEKQTFALILVFAKNDDSVSDRFSHVRGNGKTQWVLRQKILFPKCHSSSLLWIAGFLKF